MKTTKILITGDFVINTDYSKNKIDQKLIEMFKSSELNIVNLEAPITNSNSKIIKTGPHLKSNEKRTLEVLKTLNINTVTLANNHLLDYDEKGVEDTLTFCRDNNIQTVGAGMNLKEAFQTKYIESTAGRIAIVNFAENEWSNATEQSAGANPMNIIDNVNQIKGAKEKADFVFVIIHGGHEYYNLPSPRMQKQYRFYSEQGADLIVGHHTHCISGHEIYKGVPIHYSLGNFLFTNKSDFEDWYTGLVLEINIINEDLIISLHPIKQAKEDFKLNLLQDDEEKEILEKIYEYSTIISDSELLRKEWNKFVKERTNSYLSYWSPISFINNRYIKGVFNKLGIKGINKKGIAIKLNMMRCESHADLSKSISENYLSK